MVHAHGKPLHSFSLWTYERGMHKQICMQLQRARHASLITNPLLYQAQIPFPLSIIIISPAGLLIALLGLLSTFVKPLEIDYRKSID